jgi:hypothetical protein
VETNRVKEGGMKESQGGYKRREEQSKVEETLNEDG